MSYILDALTKAAKERDREAPALQRLLAPVPTRRSTWTRSRGYLFAALVLNAGLLTVLAVVWLRPVPSAVPPDSVAEPGPTASQPPQPVRLEPSAPATVREEKASRAGAAPPALPLDSRQPPSKPRAAPEPAVAPPVAAAGPPASALPAGLRLEALIYSDLPAKRMIFVNGRKYVEGDVIDGRLHVEEIQEDGVALSEQGRRFTLRFAR